MYFYISSNITLKKVMLPEKLICKSAFLVHLIKKKTQYCLMLIAPLVTEELFATLIAV